jgi:tetratricopeptide (TPR) repeat protein
MRHPGEEGALLLALAEVLDRHAMSVTFNGRTFDLPLLRTRFSQNQRIYADLRGCARLLAPERPHLDLLHPARRLWRRRLQSCRLIHLEESILGVRRSEEDVPGHLIPQLYGAYVQDGDASAMRRIFYHNLEDILSMVALTTQLSQAFNGGEQAPLEREDWLALGICFEEQKRWADAETAYQRALDLVRDPQSQADAFALLGHLLKRQGRWRQAAELWERWLSTVPGLDLRPYLELAKYCEWQLKDYKQATMWTQWALHSLNRAPVWQRPPGARADLERRLTRLKAKVIPRDTPRTQSTPERDKDRE